MRLRRRPDEHGRVDGSGTRRWEVKWAELIGPRECPLMERWCLLTPLFSIRLHHFKRSDAERDPHDHPWWFLTLVLKGGYVDMRQCPRCLGGGWDPEPLKKRTWIGCPTCKGPGYLRDRLTRGSIRFRPAEHRHWVHTENSWTLVVTGPVNRKWGFWQRDVFKPVAAYFEEYGYAPCQD